VPNRSDFGQLTYRDWFSTGAFESGYIAPDPINPNIIYSIGWYGSVLRLDRSTSQISTVFVPGPKYRYTWETPLVFSPVDKKTLYVGTQHVLKTSDGALTWQEISPDLTTRTAPTALKAHADKDETDAPQRTEQGVILTIAPSAVQAGEIWVGTSSSLVQLTRDGGATWRNVTPPGLPERSRVTRIEASPLDAETAYAVVAARGDLHPYIYRTRDAGSTWQKVVAGLPDEGVAHGGVGRNRRLYSLSGSATTPSIAPKPIHQTLVAFFKNRRASAAPSPAQRARRMFRRSFCSCQNQTPAASAP
jgi:hypothetical protein